MKTLIIIVLLLLSIPAIATEPDTIWTTNEARNGQPLFTSDGSKIIILGGSCVNVNTGALIWKNSQAIELTYNITHDDQFVVSAPEYQVNYFSIDDGTLVKSLDTIYKKNWLPFFSPHDTDIAGYKNGWQLPFINRFIYGDDDSIAYIIYAQEYIEEMMQKNLDAKAMICKYDLKNDTILKSIPFIIGGDTLLEELPYTKTRNIPNSNYFLIFQDYTKDGSLIKLYNKNTLELVSTYTIDHDKYGSIGDFVPTHSGDRIAIANEKGYLLILNIPQLTINKDLLLSTEAGYSFGHIAFSSDDSMAVTLERVKFQGNRIRRLSDTATIYQYSKDYFGGYLAVSPDDSKIVLVGSLRTILMNARWNPTSVDQEQDPTPMIIYPNPSEDFIEISDINPMLKHGVESTDIKIFNVFGQNCDLTPTLPASREGVRIDVSGLAPGMYFVRFGDRVGKFLKL